MDDYPMKDLLNDLHNNQRSKNYQFNFKTILIKNLSNMQKKIIKEKFLEKTEDCCIEKSPTFYSKNTC